MPFMWADTLEALERTHLLRLIIWGAASILAGTALMAVLASKKRSSPLLKHFGIQCAAWGCIEILLGAVFLAQVGPRDLSAATRLDRLLWLNIGLDIGYVVAGVVLAAVAWRLAKSLAALGAGIGIVVQGLALAVLDLVLASQISR